MNDLFLQPEYFWGIALLPLLGGLLWLRETVRVRRLHKLTGKNKNPSSLAVAMPCLLLLLLILAAARPHWGYETVKVPQAEDEVLVVVDISNSMLASDLSPNRLAVAKRKLIDYLSAARASRIPLRVGIVLFAGDAYLYTPATADLSVLHLFIRSISTELIASPGSDISKALSQAAATFEEPNRQRRRVLLISDGEDPSPDLDYSAAKLSEMQIPIDVLAVGTRAGGPIELKPGRFLKDRAGNRVISKLKGETLRELAGKTGGIYVEASVSGNDIQALLQPLREPVSSGLFAARTGEEIRVYRELGPFFCWGALLLFGLGLAKFRRELIFVLVLAPLLPVRAAAEDGRALGAAFSAFARGDFESARERFERALEQGEDPQLSREGLGRSLYRLGKFKEAAAHFAELAKRADSGRERFEALYNQGTSLYSSNDFEQAVKVLEEALVIHPSDRAARFNLELAKQALERQSSHSDPEDSPSPTPSPDTPQPTPPAETPTPQPEDTPGAESSPPPGSPAPTPSMNQAGDPEPTPGEHSGPAEPTPAASDAASPQPTTEPSPAPGNDEPEVKNYDSAATPAPSSVPLEQQAAEAWLESLPEEPLLLHQLPRRTNRPPEQLW